MVIDNAKFKRLLVVKGINKSLLAEKLNISSRTIAKIAKGEKIADRIIVKIADFLEVDILDLTSCILLDVLRSQMRAKLSGGLYHETQVKLTYNSNHIEGSELSEEQTRYIFETKTLGELAHSVRLDDVIETNNHFRCIDYVIEHATEELSEDFILRLQGLLKEGTEHSLSYGLGVYKLKPNTVGGLETTSPSEVHSAIKELIDWYNGLKRVTFEDIIEFHYRFECIHPFQDGNGRIGRLISFKQCLAQGIVPFYVDDRNKWLYYRGLREWKNERGFLLDTCRFGQDQYKALIKYFDIEI
ncbi:MAG: Fic family protein [Clostridia bacterium]|nr:Fic family protein [Clostridia bacterium]